MAEIANPFVANVPRKMSQEELVQALRVDIAGELEAILVYDAHVQATDDERAKKVLSHIRDEERHHVGELLALIQVLAPEEAGFLQKGKQEVDQVLGM